MIRCLVVDDSRSFRALLRAILSRAPDVEVVGEAADGDEAVAQVVALRPDVVTMDVRMPGRDGLGAIEEIMRVAPTPVVVVSAEAGPERQELSFRALQLGAIEVLGKPRSDPSGRFERDAESIRLAVRAVAGLRLVTRHRRLSRAVPVPAPAARPAAPRRDPSAAAEPAARGVASSTAAPTWAPTGAPTWTGLPVVAPPRPRLERRPPRAVGIAASTGGPAALARILNALPSSYPLPVLVVQHIAQGFEAGLVHWLGGETRLSVTLAREAEPLRAGTVYVAPEGCHLGVRAGAVSLAGGPPVRGFRPSGTALFRSLAAEYAGAAAGLVLSGMGDDGADGLSELRERGGYTAAQGPNTSAVFGMPRVAIDRGAAEETLELDEIPAALLRIAGAPRG